MRCRLLAGSVGPERVPARPDPEDADWYLPLHLRDERSARERIAAQVAAGADVVVAPTWLTHRRALLPLGETRRAAEWTVAAVRLAREAVEIGLERRAEADDGGAADGDGKDAVTQRPPPLVAASLPALDAEPEAETGRLLPQDAATQRDYRDQAGYLADAVPDLLLVEGQRSATSARAAIEEAIETGLPAWVASSAEAIAEVDLDAWLTWSGAVGVERTLLPPPLGARQPVVDAGIGWGGASAVVDEVPEWLAAGADVMARLDGAGVAAVKELRAAIDDVEREALRLERDATDRWHDHVRAAASVAPGGAAAWVGSAPQQPLPDGFAWSVVPADRAAQLPSEHFRLVVVAETPVPELESALERGGVLASRGPIRGATHGLRVVRVSDGDDPPLLLYRRED